MFNTRYFNPRYWASRYWPKVGDDAPITGVDCNAAFSGIITDEDIASNGLVFDDDIASNGLITEYCAVNGLISDVIVWTSQVSVTQSTLVGGIISLSTTGEPVGTSLSGLIDTTDTAVNGLIDTTDTAMNGLLCSC